MRHRVMTVMPLRRPGNLEMRSFVRALQPTVGVTMLLVCGMLASAAHAEICGDADGNGSVTVTDGVQVLRAAAGLSGDCPVVTCDVDGSGFVTVTDGVNVLRVAAGLPASGNCRRDPNPIILSVTDDNGIFGVLTKIPGGLVEQPGAAKTVQKVTFAASNQFVRGRVNTVTIEYDIGVAQAQTVGGGGLSLIVASAFDDATPNPAVFELPITAAKNTLAVALNVRDDVPVTQFQLRIANGLSGQIFGQIEKTPVVVIQSIPPQCGNGVLDGNETCDPPGLRCANAFIAGFCNADCACEPLSPGPTPTPILGARFVDNGDWTVTDHQTGLQWEKKTTVAGSGANFADPHDGDNLYTWCLDANQDLSCDNTQSTTGPKDGPLFTQFLAALNTSPCFAGHCDWRVPTVNQDGSAPELETILDRSAPGCGSGGPCIDQIFGSTVPGCYWSATTYATTLNHAWCVFFGNEGVDNAYILKSGIVYVRAVRAGL